jgi:uncharacterized membrane protein YgcG
MKNKYRFFLLLASVLLLAGCETVSHRDRTVLQAHGVSANLYDKMLYGDPLSLADVIELSRRGVPPGLIVHYMDETGAVYRLRKADVNRLRAAGVSDEVISWMLSNGSYGYPGYAYPNYYPYGYGYSGWDYPYYPYYDDWPYYWGGYGGWGWGRGGWGRGGGGFRGGGFGGGGGGHGGGGHGR